MIPINKEILRLALPSILANLTVPLVGMVDIAVAGHLSVSAAALIGGISIGSLMFDVIYWNFGFLRAGTGGLTAQAYGREDWDDCRASLFRGLSLALAISVVILLLQWPFQKIFFQFVRCSDEVLALALKYFYIRVWAAPATLSLMAIRGWFIGMQDTFSSMLTDLIVNGLNIIASIVLSLGIPGTGFHGLGFIGVACGTVLAQYTGLAFACGTIFTKYSHLMAGKVSLSALMDELKGDSVRRFFSVNSDLFVRSLCLIAVYLGFSAISARFGDVLLASCSIMMKLLMIFSFFTDGFAYAGEALTGKHVGMKDVPGVRLTVKWTFAWSMGIGVLFMGIYALTGMPMFRMMTSDVQVLEASRAFIPWLIAMPLFGCPAFTWDGIYIGATATRAMRDSNIGCTLGFFAVWFLGRMLLHPEGANEVHLLYVAYYTHLIYRSAYQTARYKKDVLGTIS